MPLHWTQDLPVNNRVPAKDGPTMTHVIHLLTQREEETMNRLGTLIFDVIDQSLDLNEKRAQDLAKVMEDAGRKWLEEGN